MATPSDEIRQMQAAVTCDTCKNTAKHLCTSCHDRLCDTCKDIHSKSNGTFNHKVVLFTIEALTSLSGYLYHQVCKIHPNFRAGIGCQKCDVPVCEKCLVGEHNGHSLIELEKLFQNRKEKLEQKLSIVRSELPKYKTELEKVKRRQKEVSENNDTVKGEIECYFESAISAFEAYKLQLQSSVDLKTSTSLNLLKDQEKHLQTCIQNMLEYIVNFQTADLEKRITFILYSACSTNEFIPESCPLFFRPGILKYSKGCFEKSLMHKISGDVFEKQDNARLLKKEAVQVIKTVHLNQAEVLSLSWDSGLYWVFLSNKSHFQKYNEKGVCVEEIKVDLQNTRNKPFCIVDNTGVRAIYRTETNKLSMLKDSQHKLFIDVAPLRITCLCLTRNGEILAGLVKLTKENFGMAIKPEYFGIASYSLEGVRKQFITQMMKKWKREPILEGLVYRSYITENINGDICLSGETSLMKVVNVIRPNGDHMYTYVGNEASMTQPFLPRGICTNELGHILIADENNHGIHVLNKDGGFLTILTIPDDPLASPISLCTDHHNNICIGCADGKIKVLKYLD